MIHALTSLVLYLSSLSVAWAAPASESDVWLGPAALHRPEKRESTENPPLTHAPDPWTAAFQSNYPAPLGDSILYGGPFDGPPIPHWRVALPGPPINAASHTERGEPLIADRRIYAGSAADNALFALDRQSGAFRMRYPAKGLVQSAPQIEGDAIYFTDTGGYLWCYDVDTGKERWHYDAHTPLLVQPMLADGFVYVTSVEDVVSALHADTGELAWRYAHRASHKHTDDLSLYASPSPVVAAGRLLVGFSDGVLAALDLAQGELVWQTEVGEGRYPDIVGSPLVAGDRIYVSGYYGPFSALDLQSGHIVWTASYGAAGQPMLLPELEGGMLIHPGSDGVLRALSPATGASIWSWESGKSGAISTPIVTAAGLVVALTDGTLFIIDPSTGLERWRFSPDYVLEGISAKPAVSGRQLVFATNGGFLHSMLVAGPAGFTQTERRTRVPKPQPEKRAPVEQESEGFMENPTDFGGRPGTGIDRSRGW